jgi:putative SbcD/Mre11-related phosphoesterase
MKLEPIPGEPALLIKGKKRTMIVADLHIGVEAELRESGINLPSQTEKMALHLMDLCEAHKVDSLIMVGDVKHKVPTSSRQEYFEIPMIFERLKKLVSEVHVTVGNHDGDLRHFLSDWVKIHGPGGFVHRKVGFFHGHAWPSAKVMACETVVMAHQHPTIQFIETLGERDSRQCWVKSEFFKENIQEKYPDCQPKVIIMPTFNPLLGGIALNSKDRLLGPVMKNDLVDMNNSEIYLLNGTFLGRLKDLRLKDEP